MATAEHDETARSAVKPVIYWRPGCLYCARLRWGLRRMKVTVEELNIWTDPAAAAFVRFLSGSYSNVVGLPLFETAQLLRGAGWPMP